MKNLLALFASLTIVILIASCSSNTGPDNGEQFEPYKIGSFLIVSEDSATFVGQSNPKLSSATMQEADSLLITDPEEYGLDLYRDTTMFSYPVVSFTFKDSTDITHWDWDHINVVWPNFNIHSNGWGVDGLGNIEVRGFIEHPCDLNSDEDLLIEYVISDTLHKVITMKIDGVTETSQEIIGC